jgi:hypothetical protein
VPVDAPLLAGAAGNCRLPGAAHPTSDAMTSMNPAAADIDFVIFELPQRAIYQLQ